MKPEAEQRQTSAILGVLSDARPTAEAEDRMARGALERISTPPSRRWTWVAALTVAGVTAVLVFAVVSRPQAQLAPGMYDGGREGRVLSLGRHQATLVPKARAELVTNNDALRVRLLGGRAEFDVEPLGPDERFVVVTGQVEVHVVGTRFVVDADGACTIVSVSEGKVRVMPARGLPALLVPPNEQIFCGNDGDSVLSPEAALMREALALMGSDLPNAQRLLRAHREKYPAGEFSEEAHYHLCVVTARLQQSEAAQTLANDFIKTYPDSPRAKTLRTWLDQPP